MTAVYVVIGSVFALGFAFANPGFRLWITAQRFKLRRTLGLHQAVASSSGGVAAVRAQRLPGDHAAADAEAEAQAEAAWRRRRAAQTKPARAKPGRAKEQARSAAAGGGGPRRKKGAPEEQPLDPR